MVTPPASVHRRRGWHTADIRHFSTAETRKFAVFQLLIENIQADV